MNKHRQKLEVLGSGGGGGGLGGIRRHSVHHTNLQVGKRGSFCNFTDFLAQKRGNFFGLKMTFFF